MPASIIDRKFTTIVRMTRPQELKLQLPCQPESSQCVVQSRKALADILQGRSDRLIVIISPCSIHDPACAVNYATRLARSY